MKVILVPEKYNLMQLSSMALLLFWAKEVDTIRDLPKNPLNPYKKIFTCEYYLS
jgi:hypothetical protein